jgi:hypothetical protein
MAVLIGLIASSYSNRFLGPQLKGELARISSLLSIVAVTANFGLYQPYPYYKRQGEPDVLNKFLRIFALQFAAYTVIGVLGATVLGSFELTAVCLIAPIQVLANQLSFMIMVEDVKFKNVIFFTARITNTLVTILAFYTMERTIMVALALIVIGGVFVIETLCVMIQLGSVHIRHKRVFPYTPIHYAFVLPKEKGGLAMGEVQTVHFFWYSPSAVQVGAWISSHAPGVCLVMGMAAVARIPSQTVQLCCCSPAAVQDASRITIHSPGICSAGGMDAVARIISQTAHFCCRSPSAVQDGVRITAHSPGVCSVIGIDSRSA